MNPVASSDSPAPPRFARPPIPVVVMQHVEESAHLRHVRSVLVRAPHVRLLQLGRLDERIAAHLDGVAVAGDYGVQLAQQALERPGVGEVFLASVRAIEDRDGARLQKMLAITEALPASRRGLLSALGWVSPADLKGITTGLLQSRYAWWQEAGLAACGLHGVDPGAALDAALRSGEAALQIRACRVAVQCGRVDRLQDCLALMDGDDGPAAFEAARAALLLGDRRDSIARLESIAADCAGTAPAGIAAMSLLLKLLAPDRARSMLSALAQEPASVRALIRGVAIAGDPFYVPWLIGRMDDVKLRRLAGEAFSFITGLDLAWLDLDRKPPTDLQLGPTDDPEDEDVAMDEDDSLPWPDAAKIAAWWQANGTRFVPGKRYFMGEPPSPAHCLGVLRNGFQRQRFAAAEHLSLMQPGRPLFNVCAPMRRQQRLLASE